MKAACSAFDVLFKVRYINVFITLHYSDGIKAVADQLDSNFDLKDK
jgi:hypothetical protein